MAILRRLFILVLLCSPALNVSAQDFYAGLKWGLIFTDFPLTDDGTLRSGLFGYHVNQSLDLEVEFGEIESDNNFMTGDYVALYAATTIGEQLFIRIRGGLLSEDLDFKHSIKDESNTGFSVGLTGGMFFTQNLSGELSYMWMEDSMYSLGLGVNFHF